MGATPATASTNAVDLRDPETFERLIFLKQNAAWLLEQELRKINPNDEIALGTATDPYQPIERRACITRSLLEVFARKSGYRLGIVTKSRLIERDTDLLAEIARHNKLVVHITITTPDAALARLVEPRAPLDWLVGVRSCADGDLGPRVEPAQLLFEQPRCVLFHVNFVLKGGGPCLRFIGRSFGSGLLM